MVQFGKVLSVDMLAPNAVMFSQPACPLSTCPYSVEQDHCAGADGTAFDSGLGFNTWLDSHEKVPGAVSGSRVPLAYPVLASTGDSRFDAVFDQSNDQSISMSDEHAPRSSITSLVIPKEVEVDSDLFQVVNELALDKRWEDK